MSDKVYLGYYEFDLFAEHHHFTRIRNFGGSSRDGARGFWRSVRVCRTVKEYPSVSELTRMLRVHAPEVVFLGLENVNKAGAVVKLLETEVEDLHLGDRNPSRRRRRNSTETMRIGIRELLTMPFEPAALVETLTRVKDLLDKKPLPVYRRHRSGLLVLSSQGWCGRHDDCRKY